MSTTYKNVQSLVFQCDVFFQILQLVYIYCLYDSVYTVVRYIPYKRMRICAGTRTAPRLIRYCSTACTALVPW